MRFQNTIAEIFEETGKARWLRPAELEFLERQGVDRSVISGSDPNSQYRFSSVWIPNPILIGTVEIVAGRFEFRPDGIPALVTIAIGLEGEPVDIICWSRRLNTIATWLDASTSDEGLINRPCLADADALQIAEDFVDWLVSRRLKLLILDFGIVRGGDGHRMV
jgi:hypothetical protein